MGGGTRRSAFPPQKNCPRGVHGTNPPPALSLPQWPAGTPFYQVYYLSLLNDLFVVLTDTLHKPSAHPAPHGHKNRGRDREFSFCQCFARYSPKFPPGFSGVVFGSGASGVYTFFSWDQLTICCRLSTNVSLIFFQIPTLMYLGGQDSQQTHIMWCFFL